ncbi:glycosyltransferase family 9 protein [Propionivibrio sp.]|uniref:tetratricopeptide repeat protein n=1 Tax=Propionivibrio sp. TaxID=2212460 RepID=UPI0026157649|nr:glycosyltransferase family 9 protein [Propionivibrio sp.]
MADGRMLLAEQCFRAAIGLWPDFAEAHANLGLLLDQCGLKVEAETHYLHSLACNPDEGQVHLNFAVLLAQQKRFDEADAAYRETIRLLPASAVAWSNLGVLQACRKQEVEAECSYRTAIALDANYKLAQFNFSYLLLRQGRFEEGWRCLEARNWYAPLEKRLACPRWRGESLQGKSLLIGFEAGHGDMIQFCRYAAVLKAQGAGEISLLCHPALKTLFATVAGVDTVIAFDEALPTSSWDFWTPPFSIPFYCQTRLDTIPASLPYLRADSSRREYWSALLLRDSSPAEVRVGLVWKGNPVFENDDQRSLPALDRLAPLGASTGVRFFSLQKGAGEEEAAQPPAGLQLVNLGPQLADFADTAAVIENLDLVISVDTAVAHLTGALGKPCWLLLPDYKTDWRWLAERTDSPWYPGVMRLFRQPCMGDWTSVLDEVSCALRGFKRA